MKTMKWERDLPDILPENAKNSIIIHFFLNQKEVMLIYKNGFLSTGEKINNKSGEILLAPGSQVPR